MTIITIPEITLTKEENLYIIKEVKNNNILNPDEYLTQSQVNGLISTGWKVVINE